ncbi:MAG TPA: 4-hydroxyphenylpyruvate dioxygenase, partial [Solirubrobacteraceae bacterium]|nr:4-hydroxyphenylpyruvate dioxygenase [Solirubrobacteraceae bacterium]
MSTLSLDPHPSGRDGDHRDFMPLHGIDHIELWVGNAAQAAYYLRRAFGFTEVAYAGLETGLRDRTSHVLQQGRIRLVLTGALVDGTEIGEHHRRHGDGVKRVALSVPSADAAFREATARGATALRAPYERRDDDGVVRMAEIAAYGDTVHTFVERGDYAGTFLPGYAAMPYDGDPAQPSLLAGIDHVVANVELGEMDRWVKYYEDVFGMTELIHFSDEAISTEYSALMSKVVTSGDGRVKLPINEPAEGARKSQIDEYLEFYGGAGVQHIAVSTTDIVRSVEALQAHGVAFLRTPESYYDGVPARVGEIDQSLEDLRRLGILVDRDDDGVVRMAEIAAYGDTVHTFVERGDYAGTFLPGYAAMPYDGDPA